MSMSELIKHLVAKCGPGDTSYLSDKNTSFLLLCDYKANITNSKDDIIPLVRERFLIKNFLFFIQKYHSILKLKEIGAGVYEAIWKLFLAIIFYLLMLVITFGIKVPCGLFVPSLAIGAITGKFDSLKA